MSTNLVDSTPKTALDALLQTNDLLAMIHHRLTQLVRLTALDMGSDGSEEIDMEVMPVVNDTLDDINKFMRALGINV